MNTPQPLIDKKYLLEKFSGKGGWTYARIPEIPPAKQTPFGWVRVRGSIDGIEIKNYHLMPMGNGQLFLPVKAEIRKQIKKQAGDHVFVILYADDLPTEIPEELAVCLQDELQAYKYFLKCTNGEQQAFINWIYSAKTDTTKIERIAQSVEMLSKGQRLNTKQGKD